VHHGEDVEQEVGEAEGGGKFRLRFGDAAEFGEARELEQTVEAERG
jgi:hypothetical protein